MMLQVLCLLWYCLQFALINYKLKKNPILALCSRHNKLALNLRLMAMLRQTGPSSIYTFIPFFLIMNKCFISFAIIYGFVLSYLRYVLCRLINATNTKWMDFTNMFDGIPSFRYRLQERLELALIGASAKCCGRNQNKQFYWTVYYISNSAGIHAYCTIWSQ